MGETLKKVRTPAMLFILLMGIVSMFSDMTHEGAASILGAYLSLAGASAATIGFVSGLGELIGYSMRLVTGVIADKTKKYWTLTVIGYIIDCVAIPLLALVPNGGWVLACALVIIQRTGKAIKKPSKDTILSFAASQEGAGKSFAIQEALDQIGAFLGPVILFIVMALQTNTDTFTAYSVCFAVLGIPAFATVALLLYAKRKFPNPDQFEPEPKNDTQKFVMKKSFLLYMAGAGLFAMGFVDFTLITMHVSKTALIDANYLPLLYAGAMLVDAVAALVFGWMYDKYGIGVLAISTIVSAAFSVPIFLYSDVSLTVIGVLMWGVGMGAQESILKAVVTNIVPKNMRSTGFGLFQTSFGICWFIGSWAMGIMYDSNIIWLVIFSAVTQMAAIPLFLMTSRQRKKEIGSESASANGV